MTERLAFSYKEGSNAGSDNDEKIGRRKMKVMKMKAKIATQRSKCGISEAISASRKHW